VLVHAQQIADELKELEEKDKEADEE